MFERGEVRYYDYLYEKMPIIIDPYDAGNYDGSWKHYYTRENRLTAANKL